MLVRVGECGVADVQIVLDGQNSFAIHVDRAPEAGEVGEVFDRLWTALRIGRTRPDPGVAVLLDHWRGLDRLILDRLIGA